MGDEGDNLLRKRLVRMSNQSTGACVERKNIDKKGGTFGENKVIFPPRYPLFYRCFFFSTQAPVITDCPWPCVYAVAKFIRVISLYCWKLIVLKCK